MEHEVKEKLVSYDLPYWEDLDMKTQCRLLEVEDFIKKNQERATLLKEELKGLKISKVAISNSENVSFTRKTIYNDPILNKYIEQEIEGCEDYFNERKIDQLNNYIKEFKQQYEIVIKNIIDTNLMEMKIAEYKKELQYQVERNKQLQILIAEKEKNIKSLERKGNVRMLARGKE